MCSQLSSPPPLLLGGSPARAPSLPSVPGGRGGEDKRGKAIVHFSPLPSHCIVATVMMLSFPPIAALILVSYILLWDFAGIGFWIRV